MSKTPLRVVLLVAVILVLGGAAACTAAPAPAPPAPAPVAPAPAPPVASTAAVGMKVGERFHEIHTNRLQLKCETCHVKGTLTYDDPLAQVTNMADRQSCLSCHKDGGKQPFYGENWNKAKVER